MSKLSPDALHGVIEEFVTRDGTDYGEVDVPLGTKIAQMLSQIRSGKAVIVFDQGTESCTVLRSDDPLVKALEVRFGWVSGGGARRDGYLPKRPLMTAFFVTLLSHFMHKKDGTGQRTS